MQMTQKVYKVKPPIPTYVFDQTNEYGNVAPGKIPKEELLKNN